MSDKLTPDEMAVINQYFEHDKQSVVNNLMRHIAAVEAERDEAKVLLREVAESEPYPSHECSCVYCDQYTWDAHLSTCIIERARIWLAKQEAT
jgi:hypothetical protein